MLAVADFRAKAGCGAECDEQIRTESDQLGG